MAEGHNFNFWGGEKLTAMGATWFVSYAYYENIDNEHTNWKKVKTYSTRRNTYYGSREYHKFWLEQIADMNDLRLKTNKIGINPTETKRMAKAVLEKINKI